MNIPFMELNFSEILILLLRKTLGSKHLNKLIIYLFYTSLCLKDENYDALVLLFVAFLRFLPLFESFGEFFFIIFARIHLSSITISFVTNPDQLSLTGSKWLLFVLLNFCAVKFDLAPILLHVFRLAECIAWYDFGVFVSEPVVEYSLHFLRSLLRAKLLTHPSDDDWMVGNKSI